MRTKIFACLLAGLTSFGCKPNPQNTSWLALLLLDGPPQKTKEVVIARSRLRMEIGNTQARSEAPIADQSYTVTADVPPFVTFALTPSSDFGFDVTSLAWITATGQLTLSVQYNDILDDTLQGLFVRVEMLGSEGLVGQTDASYTIPLELRGADLASYQRLTTTAQVVRSWGPVVVNEVLAFQMRGDFSSAPRQSYSGEIRFELVKTVVDGNPVGSLDAFVANDNSQANRMWKNDGAGNFSDSGQALGSSGSFGVALGDLDGRR